jgi:uncharacterized surface protein with fasciclin (FAS1) repeats
MKSNRGLWALLVLIIVVIGLGWWWIASTNSSGTSGADMASTTTATTTSNRVTAVDRSSSSVASIAESISGSATFASWLRSTGVAAQITGKGPYTIFVPTDGSISQLPKGTFTNLTAAQQKRLVQYHVVSGRAIDVSAEKAGVITALSKDPLNFSTTNNIPMVDSAIVVAEYKGSNGIVYVIDNVLIPPQK